MAEVKNGVVTGKSVGRADITIASKEIQMLRKHVLFMFQKSLISLKLQQLEMTKTSMLTGQK